MKLLALAAILLMAFAAYPQGPCSLSQSGAPQLLPGLKLGAGLGKVMKRYPLKIKGGYEETKIGEIEQQGLTFNFIADGPKISLASYQDHSLHGKRIDEIAKAFSEKHKLPGAWEFTNGLGTKAGKAYLSKRDSLKKQLLNRPNDPKLLSEYETLRQIAEALEQKPLARMRCRDFVVIAELPGILAMMDPSQEDSAIFGAEAARD